MQNQKAIQAKQFNLWYGDFQALKNVDLAINSGKVTGMIGPSGCGKSTFLRSVNRINERLSYVKTKGELEVHEQNIFHPALELAQLRKHVGMVFQRPNPLPLSIRDNILFAYEVQQEKSRDSKEERDHIVESALKKVLLWDKVKDKLSQTALGLSLEEQQKLCIARLLPVRPSILLMDEPCSALDPSGTAAIEELLQNLEGFTVLIVTHNMAQAKRISEECIFMLLGEVVEFTKTDKMFSNPKLQKTQDYIEGRYG